MTKKSHNSDNDVGKLLKSRELTNIYFNEFALGFTQRDVFILVSRNGKEEAVLNLSHTTAKNLASSLTEGVNDFEEKTKRKIWVSSEEDDTN
jgi:phosphoribosyl-AMP cyclohydrolase